MSAYRLTGRSRRPAPLYLGALCAGALAAHLTGSPAPAPARAAAPTSVDAPGFTVSVPAKGSARPSLPARPAGEWSNAQGRTPSGSAPAWTGARFRDGRIMTGSTPHRLILFSFDDGPDRRTTPLLLDRLDAAGIKALFFLTAKRMTGSGSVDRQHAAIAREVARRGHIIGSHTVDHVQLPLLDDDAVLEQLLGAERIFEEVLGHRPYLFRPPFGAHSQRIDQHLASRGYTNVLWNLGAGDFQVRSAEEVFQLWKSVFERRAREHGDRGGIILLHDTHAWSVDAFQRIVAYLMAENCRLLAAGEELYDIVNDPAFFHVPRGDAAAEVEAPPAVVDEVTLARRQAALRTETEHRCKSSLSTL